MLPENVIELEKYETRIDDNGVVTYWAIPKDKKKYKDPVEMPPCFKEMYTDKYLAITSVSNPRPEMIDEDLPGIFAIPLRTADD